MQLWQYCLLVTLKSYCLYPIHNMT